MIFASLICLRRAPSQPPGSASEFTTHILERDAGNAVYQRSCMFPGWGPVLRTLRFILSRAFRRVGGRFLAEPPDGERGGMNGVKINGCCGLRNFLRANRLRRRNCHRATLRRSFRRLESRRQNSRRRIRRGFRPHNCRLRGCRDCNFRRPHYLHLVRWELAVRNKNRRAVLHSGSRCSRHRLAGGCIRDSRCSCRRLARSARADRSKSRHANLHPDSRRSSNC